MRKWALRGLILAAALLVTWLAWSGHYTGFLIGVGVSSCLLVVGLSMWMGIVDEEGVPARLILRSLTYLPWLALQVIISGLKVSRAIVDPRRKIKPTLVRLPVPQRTEVGAVVYANSITLTPGTLSVRMEDDILLVHALFPDDAEALAAGDMADRVSALEGPT
jgi:multicomponent Na+:H+ antiporter subunit E